MAEPYRFGGPTPESVKALKARRRFRDSSLYARMKRARRERAEEERAAQYERDAKAGGVRVHRLESPEPVELDFSTARHAPCPGCEERIRRLEKRIRAAGEPIFLRDGEQ